MNINAPVMSVIPKATHVHFKTSEAILVNGRRVDAIPSNRRSMIAMVPNTIVRPMTWDDSMNGKRYSESRILVARLVDSMDARSSGIVIELKLRRVRPRTPHMVIRDQTSEDYDSDPNEERE